MRYNVVSRKKFRYIKTYKVLKKANEGTNAASKLVQRLIDRYVLRKSEAPL